MIDSSILLDAQRMERFAEDISRELPIFSLYATPEAFAKRWVLGGCLADGAYDPGVYVVLVFRGRIRLFHAGETDEGLVGWVREIDDPLEMTGTVIGTIESLDAPKVARIVMQHFWDHPDSGTELVPTKPPSATE